MWKVIDRLLSCVIFAGLVAYGLWIVALEIARCGVLA